MDWSRDMDDGTFPPWGRPGANFVMDVHGDPMVAQLVILSDGNHHMALRRVVRLFLDKTDGLDEICFLTTPPGPLVNLIYGEKLVLGNLHLSVCPQVFISPPHVLDRMAKIDIIDSHTPFVRSRGCVLLVQKDNPRGITGIADLAREGIRLFISSPDLEKDSHNTYSKTLMALSEDPCFLDRITVVPGQAVHHREAPEALYRGTADAAVLFYHLARHYALTFPDLFEMVPLGGTAANPRPAPGNIISHTHAAVIRDGGKFGRPFFDFLFTPAVKKIYRDCGLVPL